MILKKLKTLPEVLHALANGYTVVEPDGSALCLGLIDIERIDIDNLMEFGDLNSESFNLCELRLPCTVYDTTHNAELWRESDFKDDELSRLSVENVGLKSDISSCGAKAIKEFGDKLLRTCEMSIENGGNDVEFTVYLGGLGPGSHKATTLPQFIKELSSSEFNQLMEPACP